MSKKLTTEEFIEKARLIHGDKYDYSKVEYKNYNTNITIICPEHGEFYQKPNSHLQGCGCKKCNYKFINKNRKLTTEEFIQKAIEIHGNKYDYSKVDYVNNKTKVCIICPEHGEFWQKPVNHLNGSGCKKCIINERKLTTEEFIKKARIVHEYKYDYSKVKYLNSNNKVCIICPEHGEFWQKPNDHLDGHGCPLCNERKLEKETRLFLTKKNIDFMYQKHFEWLGKLSLDFYLPDYNIAIECQGKQHFEPNEYFGGKKSYQEQVERDIRKKNLCKENGVKLCFINYYDNVIEKLLHILD